MLRASLFPAGVLVLGVFLFSPALPSSAIQQSPSKSGTRKGEVKELPHPVIDIHHLMEYFNQPLYRNLSEEMQAKEMDEAKFESIAKRGAQAAELANLVAIRDHQFDRQQWNQFARELQQAGIELQEAAKSKSAEGTRRAYGKLIQNCNDCHNKLAAGRAPTLVP